jgi:hypothetical protein
MANIWQPPTGGYVDGPGLVCVGSLDTDPTNPWGRTNPWAYDGAIFGYREFADPPGSGFQYSVLGGVMSVCTSDPDITAADKLAAVADLNTGCNVNPFAGGHVLVPDYDNDVSVPGYTWGIAIYCSSDGGDVHAFVKASMCVYGNVRDVLTMNDLGPDNTPLSQAFGVTSGKAALWVELQSEAASDLWQVLVAEVQALWNEH